MKKFSMAYDIMFQAVVRLEVEATSLKEAEVIAKKRIYELQCLTPYFAMTEDMETVRVTEMSSAGEPTLFEINSKQLGEQI